MKMQITNQGRGKLALKNRSAIVSALSFYGHVVTARTLPAGTTSYYNPYINVALITIYTLDKIKHVKLYGKE